MFGDYRVVERLGKGGMGEVWLVEIESRHAVFAVKLLDPGLVEKDREFRKRFLHEAQIAMAVKNPYLLKVYDVGQDPDTNLCYLIMECLSGGSLADRLAKEGALPIEDAIRITYQIATALAAVDEQGIVHRDLKPDNILFDVEGRAKLTDLGIAKMSNKMSAMTMTMPGTVIGTPAYMSPEQMLDSHLIDIRSDIYSLGLVFYEMLTGKCLHEDSSIVEAVAKAMQRVPIPDVREVRPEVPENVARLVAKMLEYDLEKRVTKPAEVATALSQIVNGLEVTMLEEKKGERVKGERGKRRRNRRKVRYLIILGIVVAVLVAAADFAVYWFMVKGERVKGERALAPQSRGGAEGNGRGGDLRGSASLREPSTSQPLNSSTSQPTSLTDLFYIPKTN